MVRPDSYVAMADTEETDEEEEVQSCNRVVALFASSHRNVQVADAARSIKLGLGDFVFYSVLVSRAALFGFATFAACFVAVIMVRVPSMLGVSLLVHAISCMHPTGLGGDAAVARNFQESASRASHLHCSGCHVLLHHPPCVVPHDCFHHRGWHQFLAACAVCVTLTTTNNMTDRGTAQRHLFLAAGGQPGLWTCWVAMGNLLDCGTVRNSLQRSLCHCLRVVCGCS